MKQNIKKLKPNANWHGKVVTWAIVAVIRNVWQMKICPPKVDMCLRASVEFTQCSSVHVGVLLGIP